jgi:hypothetical protein
LISTHIYVSNKYSYVIIQKFFSCHLEEAELK